MECRAVVAMFDDKRAYTFDRVVRMVLTASILIGLFLLLRFLSDVLVPFVAAVVLAYLLNPIVMEFEKRTKRRGTAVAFTLSGLGIVTFALFVIVVPLMYAQFGRFREDLERIRGEVRTAYTAVVVTRPDHGLRQPPRDADVHDDATTTTGPAKQAAAPETLSEWEALQAVATIFDRSATPLSERLERLFARVEGTYVGVLLRRTAKFVESEESNELAFNVVKRLFAGGVTVISFAVEFVFALTGLIIAVIYLVFLLLDFPNYTRTWREFLPPQYRPRIVAFLREFDVALRRYFRGQFVVAALTGVLFAIGFSIMRLPMAVPFGLFVGVLNMVPYLQAVALVPGGLLAILRSLETGSLVGSFGWVALVFVVVQVLQDAVITPRVMGRATGLRPVAILLGVFVWGKLLGFLGLLLAIPLTCLAIAYYRRFVLRHGSASVDAADNDEALVADA